MGESLARGDCGWRRRRTHSRDRGGSLHPTQPHRYRDHGGGLIDNTTRTSDAIENLRESSIRLSIDDFLTGYSNFAYIRQFQASHIKIDRSFVSDIDSDLHNPTIVRCVIQMTDTLGVSSVAEGIETQAEAATLAALGCEIGQGYLFARPQLAQDTELLLGTQTQFSL